MVRTLTTFATAVFIAASAVITQCCVYTARLTVRAMQEITCRTIHTHMAHITPVRNISFTFTAVHTVVFCIAITSAFFAAVVAAITDVAVAAEGAAVLTVNLLIPRV